MITINMLGCSEYFVNKTYLGRRLQPWQPGHLAGWSGPGNIKHLVKYEERAPSHNTLKLDMLDVGPSYEYLIGRLDQLAPASTSTLAVGD